MPKGMPCTSGRDLSGHDKMQISDKLEMRTGWKHQIDWSLRLIIWNIFKALQHCTPTTWEILHQATFCFSVLALTQDGDHCTLWISACKHCHCELMLAFSSKQHWRWWRLATDGFLFPSRNSTVLNSKVLSVTIKPTPASLSAPVVVEFSHLYNVSNSCLN